jgi:hypothetical protein
MNGGDDQLIAAVNLPLHSRPKNRVPSNVTPCLAVNISDHRTCLSHSSGTIDTLFSDVLKVTAPLKDEPLVIWEKSGSVGV